MATRRGRAKVVQHFSLASRRSGVLLHITSLEGPYGCGDLGDSARRFVDWLAASGQTWWEVLPLSPLGKGNCPYASASAFASEPLLISLEGLVGAGWLKKSELPKGKTKQATADYDFARKTREPLLRRAYERFSAKPLPPEFSRFVEREAAWLSDHALYQAIVWKTGETSWRAWPKGLRDRDPKVCSAFLERFSEEVGYQLFLQWVLDAQWHDLRAYANDKHVALMGDVPIFVALDSADVWANREIFRLRKDGDPEVVAGVPPDHFNKDGQLWGNALYRWDVLKKDGYAWWVARFRRAMEMFDSVRIDHFIGFTRYYAIPGRAKNARKGRWEKVPGRDFFATLRKRLGTLPFVAEDLGNVSQEVWDLRDEFHFPGMRVLQFAFGEGGDFHRPHAYTKESVVYPGTHDNDTAIGWWKELGKRRDPKGRAKAEIAFLRSYLGVDGDEIHWDLIRAAWASPANLAIVPMQDVLGLDGRHRMNRPGIAEGQWEWRLPQGWDAPLPAGRLAWMTRAFGRGA